MTAAWAASTGPEDGTSTGLAPSTGEAPIELCEGPVAVRYDPAGGGIDAFPDDVLTEDAATVTGLRVRDLGPTLPDDEPLVGFPSLYAGLATLDGFGTTAPMFLRLSGPVDPQSLPEPGAELDPERATLVLVDLDADPPTLVELDWRVQQETPMGEEVTILIDPLHTLRPGTRYGVALTRGATDVDGNCLAPSTAMATLLRGEATDPPLSRVQNGILDLVGSLVELGIVAGAGDLSSAVVFTTQTTLVESPPIAAAIRGANPPPLTPAESCPFYGPYRLCEAALTVADFTSGGVVTDAPYPQGFYDLPVSVYLPPTGQGPFPTIFYGHGLWGDRSLGWQHAVQVCPKGYAVVSIDAPKHGAHPDAPLVNEAVDLLGVTGDPTDPFLPLVARDNFRKAAFDKLQVLRRIEAGMDVDGNGSIDLDYDRLHYFGGSLGAVMAPQFLAFAPEITSATLVVGGARLTDIVGNAEAFAPIVVAVTPDLSRGERTRFLAIAQAVLDRGDPEVFARHVMRDRIEGFEGKPPQLLAQMAVGDDIVPNSSSAHLLRSLGIPVVGEVPVPMRGAEVRPELPMSGNLAPGLTAGLFQFELVSAEGSATELEPATHYNVQSDFRAHAQQLEFLETAATPAGSTIVDPYLQ